jgi:hypothetical protein
MPATPKTCGVSRTSRLGCSPIEEPGLGQCFDAIMRACRRPPDDSHPVGIYLLGAPLLLDSRSWWSILAP